MMVYPDGSARRLLAQGEVKDIETGRVILVPGPTREVETIREIYRLKIVEGRTANAIARDLNRQGIERCGRPWTGACVLEVLTNPKYVGCAVWGRTTGPLGKKIVNVPQLMWTMNPGAFEPIVDQQTFDQAQRAVKDRTCNESNGELLDGLRFLLKREGKLSQHIVEASKEVPAASTYSHRFGSLRQAYALIGYEGFKNHQGMLRMRRRHHKIEQTLFRDISKIFGSDVKVVRERNVCRRVLCFQDGLTISILICQFLDLGSGDFRWAVPVNRFESHYPTLICRCAVNNDSFKDFYLLPRVETTRKFRFRIKESDPWLRTGRRVSDLSQLHKIATRLIHLTHGSPKD
jgi:hypothetical protein